VDVRLSSPVKTRAIASAKIKTYKLDAVKLADLMRGGYIAEVIRYLWQKKDFAYNNDGLHCWSFHCRVFNKPVLYANC
jgi:hypothetical protein